MSIFKNKKISIITIIVIVIIATLTMIQVLTGNVGEILATIKHAFFRGIGIEQKEGNSAGNINNFGYAAEDNKYLYYMSPSEDGRYIGITKVSKKKVTSKPKRLIEGEWEIASINSYGDYIYFVTLIPNEEGSTNNGEVDNKIHRIRKDGKKHEIINDNEFQDYAYKISVVDGKVYYIGVDECIWYMDLNGKHKTRLNENATGFEFVTNKYIVYNMQETVNEELTTVTYIMNRNGKNARKITGKRLYTPIIQGDYVYYLTSDRYLHRVKLDGKDDEMLSSDIIFNLNVTKDGIFYMTYNHDSDGNITGLSIVKTNLEGKERKQLHKLEESSSSICVLKNWIYYLDNNDEQGRMEIVSLDGKQQNVLFALNYDENYYYKETTQEDTEDVKQVETETQAEAVE